ncbi:MAG: beta strand repeat-containing protein [Steroidobacteraceae bacterium]
MRAQFRAVIGTAAGTTLYNSLNGTVEKRALLDIAYFRGAGKINANLIRALNDQNRAEAWFQIRYNELPPDPDPGHSLRLYRDADLFGLYDTTGGANVVSTEDESKQTYKMLTSHRDVINAYEISHPHPVDGQSLTDALTPARDAFIGWVNSAQLLEGQPNLVAGSWNPAAIYYNPAATTLDARGDDGKANNLEKSLLVGSDGADVIWAGAGDDVLIGGAGGDTLNGGAGADVLIGGTGFMDVLSGGAGNDTYVFKSGDGIDKIVGDATQGNNGDDDGKIVYDGITLTGTNAKSVIDFRYGNNPAWEWGEGGQSFHAKLVDGDLTSGGTLRVAKGSGGDFGTDYIDIKNFKTNDLGLGLVENKQNALTTGDVSHNVFGIPNYTPGTGNANLPEGPGLTLAWNGNYAASMGSTLTLTASDPVLAAQYLGATLGDSTVGFNADGTLTINLTSGRTQQVFSLRTLGDVDTNSNFTLTATVKDVNGNTVGSAASLNVALNATTELTSSNADTNYFVTPTDGNPAVIYWATDGSWGPYEGPDYWESDLRTRSTRWAQGYPGTEYESEFIDRSQTYNVEFAATRPLLTTAGLGDSYLVGSNYRDVMTAGFLAQYDANNGLLPGLSSGTVGDNDTLIGGLGDDVLQTNGGDDRSYGGDGNDLLIDTPIISSAYAITDWADRTWLNTPGHTNNDQLYGEAGNDQIVAGGGNALLDGGTGNDELYGGDDDDTLLGGDGDDILWGDSRQINELWLVANGVLYDPALLAPGLKLYEAGAIDEAATAPGKDFLDGGDGNDTLRGGGNSDVLYGGAGNDSLVGDDAAHEETAGDDYLNSEDGNDTLYGEAGADTLIGGAGDDQLMGDGLTTTAANQGNDFLDGGLGNDTLWGNGGADTLLGGDGNDYLEGDYSTTPTSVQGNDYLDGGAGTDTLSGGDGDDYLQGDSSSTPAADQAADYLDGGAGNDVLIGDGGADTLLGGAGDDQLDGDSSVTPVGVQGDDYLDGGEGNDVLFGWGGNDTLIGGSGNDTFDGGAGNDTIVAGGGNALLDGGAGADELYAGQDDDTLLGGDGDDVLWGDGQQARMDVDTGTGPLGYTDAWSNYNGWLLGWVQPALADPNVKAYNWGTTLTDTLTGVSTTYQWQGIVEAITYTGKDFLDGGNGNDELRGGGNSDVLYGGAGNDSLVGDDAAHEETAGDDYLNGEDGNDTLYGEAGADTLIGGAGDDQLMGDGLTTTSAKQGNDFLDGGAGADTLWGNGGADTLLGGDGNDYLEGDYSTTPISVQGNDYLDGGAGDDTLLGDGGSDTLVGGTGLDHLYGGAGADTLSGGDGDDYLQGDSSSTAASDQAADYLDGGAGNDVLIGDGGADTLLGGAGDDQLDGDSSATPVSVQGDDYVDGGDGNDVLFGWGGNDTLIGGAGNDTFDGGDGDDILDGGNGNDVIYGGAGNDTIYAGAGTDYLSGDAGNDTYIFSGSELQPENGFIDSVVDTQGNDAIVFRDGLALSEVDYVATSGSSVQIGTAAGDRRLSIASSNINLQFSDGQALTLSQLVGQRRQGAVNVTSTTANTVTLGGYDNDSITALGANATLSGGSGNDQLIGSSSESTTFLYSWGDNNDSLGDHSTQAADGSGPINTLMLSDINLANLKIQDRDGQRFLIVDSDGSLQVGSATADVVGDRVLDRIQFADGSVKTWAEVVAALGVEVLGTSTGSPATISGTNANDRIVGGADDETISTGAGDDQLMGDGLTTTAAKQGNDFLDGGLGNDTLWGNGGSDTLLGGDGNDYLEGDYSTTPISVQGNDYLDGGADDDTLMSGTGDDILSGSTANDSGFDYLLAA